MRFDRYIAPVLLLISAAVILRFIMASEGFHGGGDSLAHFRLAKFSWDHPIHLLDHWGKPLFTLLNMPFARFGFKGVQVFNLICGLLCCVLAIRIAAHQHWGYRWVIVPIIMFTPVFFREFFSGLTEVCLAMSLLLFLLLRLRKRHATALILLSFLPFIRTEGLLFIVWFGLIDILERRSWQVLLVSTGAIVYSLIGWLAKGDILWLLHEMPYVGGEHIYGSGSLFHYMRIMPGNLGAVTLSAMVISIALLVRARYRHAEGSRWMLLNVLLPLLAFIGFHSVMWWMGRVSLGLPRMLAVIVPSMALMLVFGLDQLRLQTNRKWLPFGLALLTSGSSVVYGFRSVQLPVPLGQEEQVLKETATYIVRNGLSGNRIHYYALYSEMVLNLDPHNTEQCQQVVHNRSDPQDEVRPGSLVIWDAHFSPNEGVMPLENLLENEFFEVVSVFRPEHPFNTLGDRPFEVYLFQRK